MSHINVSFLKMLTLVFALLLFGASRCDDEEEDTAKPDTPSVEPSPEGNPKTGTDKTDNPKDSESAKGTDTDDSDSLVGTDDPDTGDTAATEENDQNIGVKISDASKVDYAYGVLENLDADEYGDMWDIFGFVSRIIKKPVIVDTGALELDISFYLPQDEKLKKGQRTPMEQEALNRLERKKMEAALLSILRMNQFTAIDTGQQLEILKIEEAKSKLVTRYDLKDTYDDQLVSLLLNIKGVSMEEVGPTLEKFLSKHGEIVSVDSNTVVINDFVGSIRRVKSALKMLMGKSKKPSGKENTKGETTAEASQSEDDVASVPCEVAGADEIPLTGPVEVSYDGCGCAIHSPDHGALVYGFLSDPSSSLELSDNVFNRIALPPLSLNEELSREQGRRMNDFARNVAVFTQKAKKYRNRVDLYFTKNDWREEIEVCEAVDNANCLYPMTDRECPDKVVLATLSVISAVRSVVESGPESVSVLSPGGGITINFDGYPTDENAAKEFVRMVVKIKELLASSDFHSMEMPTFLNIVFPLSEIGNGAWSFDRLKAYVTHRKNNPQVRLLVALGSDSSTDKKLLRKRVENAYHGDERRTLLRAMIPLISGENCDDTSEAKWNKQIKDDIVYAFDNFGGVGFLSLDIEKSWPDAGVATRIRDEINALDTGKTLRGRLDGLFPHLNKIFCPHSGIFQILAYILAVLILAFNLVCPFVYKLRALKAQYWFIHVGVFIATVALWFILALYDPAIVGHIVFIAFLAFLGVVGYAFVKTLAVQNRRHYP